MCQCVVPNIWKYHSNYSLNKVIHIFNGNIKVAQMCRNVSNQKSYTYQGVH